MKPKFMSFLLLTSLCFTGCVKKPVSTNPKVVYAQTVDEGSQAVQTLSLALVDAQKGLYSVKADMDPKSFTEADEWIIRIAKANDNAIAALRSARNGDPSVNWKEAIDAIALAASTADPTTFGFKNPTSQKTFQILSASLAAAIKALPSSIQPAN